MQIYLRFFLFGVIFLLVLAFTCYVKLIYFIDLYSHLFYDDTKDLQQYDYIVVGAGSAGAILSARLADDEQKVLLLEAGGVAPPFLDIPLLAPILQRTPYDWQYTTVPQENACKGLMNNKSKWPMGKLVGGSSRLNYMVYLRGHPLDYKEWFPDFVEPIVNKSGPMHVSELKWSSGVGDTILNGIKELNEQINNINKNSKTGFMKAQFSQENGKRWSADRFLYQNSKSELTIITHALVDKVLIESQKAVGVRFLRSRRKFTALARKAVILSAGAIGTPKLLLLSGIGPKKHLEDLKINVIKNLPVGQHLVDHILTGIDLVTLNVSFPANIANALNPLSAFRYFFCGEGPWTSSGIELVGTFYSSLKKNKSGLPDLQIMVLPLGLSEDNGIVLKEALGISDKIYNEYFSPLVYKNVITIAPVLLHPKSNGEVKLKSTDPLDAPLIDPKYLSHEDDVVTLIDGLQFVQKLVKTNAMKALGASIYKKQFPGCEDKMFGSTDYWECYVRHLTLTSYHPAGTCRMGDVVDASFRVYGIENLYAVDASVFPTLPSGNINAAVIMIAEKAARLFKESHRIRTSTKSRYKSNSYCDVFLVCDIEKTNVSI